MKGLFILPNADKAVIPSEKFTEYSLNPLKQKDKAIAFERALGYNMSNYQKLIDNIRANITKFTATPKPDIGYGQRYQIIMELVGENAKSAKVLTAWIFSDNKNIPTLTSAYIDK